MSCRSAVRSRIFRLKRVSGRRRQRLRVWGGRHARRGGGGGVRRIKHLADPENELRSCCGSTAWVKAMAENTAVRRLESDIARAIASGNSLSPDDWMEAFRVTANRIQCHARMDRGRAVKV